LRPRQRAKVYHCAVLLVLLALCSVLQVPLRHAETLGDAALASKDVDEGSANIGSLPRQSQAGWGAPQTRGMTPVNQKDDEEDDDLYDDDDEDYWENTDGSPGIFGGLFGGNKEAYDQEQQGFGDPAEELPKWQQNIRMKQELKDYPPFNLYTDEEVKQMSIKERWDLAKRLFPDVSIGKKLAWMQLVGDPLNPYGQFDYSEYDKAKWIMNKPNMTVTLFGKVIGLLPMAPIWTRWYYPEEDFGRDLWRFKILRAHRQLKLWKVKNLMRARYIVNDMCLDPLKENARLARDLLLRTGLEYVDLAKLCFRKVASLIVENQDNVAQGAMALGVGTALLFSARKTILNDEWRTLNAFVAPDMDTVLERGTMVYAPTRNPKWEKWQQMKDMYQQQLDAHPQMVWDHNQKQLEKGKKGSLIQRPPKKPEKPPELVRMDLEDIPEIKWVLGEVQDRIFPGDVGKVMLYQGRQTVDVAHEDLRLGRPEDQFLLTAIQGNPDMLVKQIEENGADVNARDMNGNTALIFAAELNNAKAVQVLLEHGANPNIANFQGVTPLLYACARGQVEISEMLLDYGARINKALPDGKSPLFHAVGGGHMDLVQRLLDRGARAAQMTKSGTSPLFVAAQNGDAAMCQTLLDAGATWTMNVAADLGTGKCTPLFMAVQKNSLGVVKTLAEYGVNLDKGAVDKKNPCTPLMVTAQSGNGPMCQYLLQMGADPDLTLKDGSSALHLCVQQGHAQIAQLLINAGADLDKQIKNSYETPLTQAIKNKQTAILRMLLENGCDTGLYMRHIDQRLQRHYCTPLIWAMYQWEQAQEEADKEVYFEYTKMLLPYAYKTLQWRDDLGYNGFYHLAGMLKGDDLSLWHSVLKTNENPYTWAKAEDKPKKKKKKPYQRTELALLNAGRDDLLFMTDNYDPKDPDKVLRMMPMYYQTREMKDYMRMEGAAAWEEISPLEGHYPPYPTKVQLSKRVPPAFVDRVKEVVEPALVGRFMQQRGLNLTMDNWKAARLAYHMDKETFEKEYEVSRATHRFNKDFREREAYSKFWVNPLMTEDFWKQYIHSEQYKLTRAKATGLDNYVAVGQQMWPPQWPGLPPDYSENTPDGKPPSYFGMDHWDKDTNRVERWIWHGVKKEKEGEAPPPMPPGMKPPRPPPPPPGPTMMQMEQMMRTEGIPPGMDPYMPQGGAESM